MKPILYTLLALVLFSNCRKDKPRCEEMTTTFKYLTATSLERTRYFTDPAFDTVKLKSNKGDTLIFVKSVCDTIWFDDYKTWGNPDCGPYANEKNQGITNTYKTLKGEGEFKVKHSLKTRTKFDNNIGDYVIEIYFLNHHFYFFEMWFNDPRLTNYFGDYTIGDITFSNVFYHYPDLKNVGIRGFMAPGYGLIVINDLENNLTYEFLK